MLHFYLMPSQLYSKVEKDEGNRQDRSQALHTPRLWGNIPSAKTYHTISFLPTH